MDREDRWFEERWEEIAQQLREEDRERRRAFAGVFEAGGADAEEAKRHAAHVLDSLARCGCFGTLAVVMRGFGRTEEHILDAIKWHHLHHHLGPGAFWEAVREAGIHPDAQTVVDALGEISARRREDLDDIPW